MNYSFLLIKSCKQSVYFRASVFRWVEGKVFHLVASAKWSAICLRWKNLYLYTSLKTVFVTEKNIIAFWLVVYYTYEKVYCIVLNLVHFKEIRSPLLWAAFELDHTFNIRQCRPNCYKAAIIRLFRKRKRDQRGNKWTEEPSSSGHISDKYVK